MENRGSRRFPWSFLFDFLKKRVMFPLLRSKVAEDMLYGESSGLCDSGLCTGCIITALWLPNSCFPITKPQEIVPIFLYLHFVHFSLFAVPRSSAQCVRVAAAHLGAKCPEIPLLKYFAVSKRLGSVIMSSLSAPPLRCEKK